MSSWFFFLFPIHRLNFSGNHQHHRIIDRPRDLPVMHKQCIGDPFQSNIQDFSLICHDRFFGSIAARGNHGTPEQRHQEMVQGRCRQHHTQIRIARRHRVQARLASRRLRAKTIGACGEQRSASSSDDNRQ